MIPFHIAKPQGCDIQIYYGNDSTGNNSTQASPWQVWNKPAGVSHIYMLLIGAGGNGRSTQSGGSGAITVWYGAAQHVPNSLRLLAANNSSGNPRTIVAYLDTTSDGLLYADMATNITAGAAMTANNFTASGFFQSTAGQNGVTVGAPSASPTTFLSAGAFNGSPSANYGYIGTTASSGYFMMQPIIVGRGAGSAGAAKVTAAYGCGAGSNAGAPGGPGLILIASW